MIENFKNRAARSSRCAIDAPRQFPNPENNPFTSCTKQCTIGQKGDDMKTHANTIPISEARQELPELVNKVRKLHSRYFITKRGKVEAVIISSEEFESWAETLDILSNKAEMKAIQRALNDIKKGRVKSFKEVFKEDQ